MEFVRVKMCSVMSLWSDLTRVKWRKKMHFPYVFNISAYKKMALISFKTKQSPWKRLIGGTQCWFMLLLTYFSARSRFETENTSVSWLIILVSSKGHTGISSSLLVLIFLSVAGQEIMSWWFPAWGWDGFPICCAESGWHTKNPSAVTTVKKTFRWWGNENLWSQK